MNRAWPIGGGAPKMKALNCNDGSGAGLLWKNPASCLAELNAWWLFRIVVGERRMKSFDVSFVSLISSGISEAKTPQTSTHTIVENSSLVRRSLLQKIT